MMHRRIRLLTLLMAPALLVVVSCSKPQPQPALPSDWLEAREVLEQRDLSSSSAPHDFQFTDALSASGISFVNRFVDDAGKAYKPVHYDHGTGVAAADVDGDGLVDLYFVSQLGTSELWRNRGGGCFTNMTARSGLTMKDAVAVGASFADIDNDGDPDLFVTTVRHGNRLFENTGGGVFKDISRSAGVGFVGHSSGSVFFDYDGDGLLDLFVTNVGRYTNDAKGRGGYHVGMDAAFFGHLHAERSDTSILYRNLGGNRFQDVTRETGLIDAGWSGEATILDANRDGRMDLLTLNMQGRSRLWLNDGGRFTDATARYTPRTPWGAMGAKVLDFDNDGRFEILVTDMHSDMFDMLMPDSLQAESRKSNAAKIPDMPFPEGKAPYIFGNALFTEGKSGVWDEVSDAAGVETYWPWGPSAGDLNADGYDDLFVTAGMNFPFRYAPNSLLLNDGGKRFLPAAFALKAEPRSQLYQPWFGLDCAGADKGSRFCKPCEMQGEGVGCRREANGTFTMLSSRASRSSVILDLDADGDLDIVTNEFGASPQILLSNLTMKHQVRFIEVRLRGTRSNADGLGAVVTATLPGGMKVSQRHDGKSGYLSQSRLPLYFGLGARDQAASVEVRWPSGVVQTIPGPISSGRTVEIVEPR